MFNEVHLLGRLTADPEVKYTAEGRIVAQFILAVNRTNAKETDAQKADFIPCVAFDKVAETIGNTLSKGKRMLVSRGTLRINKYKDKQGNNRYHTEVHIQSYDYIDPKESSVADGTVVAMKEEIF